MGGTMVGWGALLIASAVTLIAYELGLATWELFVVFILVALGATMLKVGK